MSNAIRRHISTNAFLWARSCWKPFTLETPRSFSSHPSSRVATVSNLLYGPPRSKPMAPANINQIKKRFFRSVSGSSRDMSSFSHGLFAALGILIGIFSGDHMHHSLRPTNHSVACEADDTSEEDDCTEKKCENNPSLRKRDCEEELIIKTNAELELALMDTKSKAVEYTEAAMKAYCEAIEAMEQFLEYGYCVVNNDKLECLIYQEIWVRVYEMSAKRCEKVNAALVKGQTAWELCLRLRDIIKKGQTCKFTAFNALLVPLEESVQCIEKELLDLKTKMEAVHSTHCVVAKYKSEIGKFREELLTDVRKNISRVGLGCCKTRYAEQEKALMMAEAYKRVIRLHKELVWKQVCAPPPVTNKPDNGDEEDDDDEDCECEDDDED